MNKTSRRSKASLPKQRLTFRLHAPEANSVHVSGTFCEWRPDAHPLKKDAKGTWKTQVSLPPGRHEYRFLVDGIWQDDPHCLERVPNSFGTENCVLHVLHEVTQEERAKVASQGIL